MVLGVAVAACGRVGATAVDLDGGDASPDSSAGLSVCSAVSNPATPIEYGASELAATLTAAGSTSRACVTTVSTPDGQQALAAARATVDPKAESYVIVSVPGDATVVVGRDAVGAMYGALELAERVRLDGPRFLPLTTPIAGAPSLPIRGAQLYLVMQEPNEPSWWLRDTNFWTEYLDLLAHARIDFLDLRGMYNLANTVFPNPLLYFATSPTYPNVGIAQSDRDANIAMLRDIVQMASVRGIRVGFMAFRADTNVTGDPNGPSVALTDIQLQAYTREAVADIVRKVPGLWRMGTRIGESGYSAAWFKDSFVAGLKDAAQGTGFYVRTWGSSKSEVLDLISSAVGESIVEAKYNGEHLGPPYIIAGGEFASWGASYSYEDYVLPPSPYAFVFEVRTGGTHRMFRFASYARTQRAVQSSTLGPSKGFSLEAPHVYSPQRDFYHTPGDRYSPWTFRRDELQYLLFGRLGYDASTPERVFRAALAARTGTDSLWGPVQAASDIVDWIQTAHTCGPDERNFAPDEEWGGPVGYWAGPAAAAAPAHACATGYQGPFDTFAVASPFDLAGDLVAGGATARVTPLEVARNVLADVQEARAASGAQLDPNNAWARDFARECGALADLGEYFARKLRGASALAVHAASGSSDYLAQARSETRTADDAWSRLAQDTAYIAPFDDYLRVGAAFHWRNELPFLPDDARSIDAVAAAVAAAPPPFHGVLPAAATWLDATRPAGPGLSSLSFSPRDATAPSWTVTAALGGAVAGITAQLWYKPAASHTAWSSVPMAVNATKLQASIPGTGAGVMVAVEVSQGKVASWRYPDPLAMTPYVVLTP